MDNNTKIHFCNNPKNWIRLVLVCMLFLFVAIEAVPGVLFRNSYHYRNLVIYSATPLSPDINKDLDQALQLLSRSAIYNATAEYHIVIADNRLLYSLIGPDFSRGTFARTNVFNNIVIRRCAPDMHQCYSDSADHNIRSLAGLVAHEASHVNLRQQIGLIREALLASWIKEGYADYIASSSSYTDANAFEQYLSGAKVDTRSFDYYTYRMAVTYALDSKGLTIRQLIDNHYTFSQLRDEERKNHGH